MSKHLTLYELNSLLKEVISSTMTNRYWVEAEIASVSESGGHCYLELIQKEEGANTPIAKARANIWRNTWQELAPRFRRVTGENLHRGMQVLLLVSANFHQAYGFSWIVDDIDPTYTMGDMMRRRQEIIRILKEEGVFDLNKELAIPMFCQRIAVISSATAAGYGDFCDQLHNNDYGLVFYPVLFPAIMQGEQVETSIIEALNAINENIDDYDVVVIIRGGGSSSDLSGFDSLSLAENVANFPLPVITGIGHERDDTVIDMVSHTRVKTPTAAAAFLIQNLCDVLENLLSLQRDIIECVEDRLSTEHNHLERLSERLISTCKLACSKQLGRVDRLFADISAGAKSIISNERHLLDRRIMSIIPSVTGYMDREKGRIKLLEQRCKALDPLLLLKRGYSITLKDGKIVRDVATLTDGDVIETRVQKGTVKSKVIKK